MIIWECRPYILFIPIEKAAVVVFEEHMSSEPVFSKTELVFAITSLCKLGLLNEITAEMLQVDALQVPLREEGIRPRLVSDGKVGIRNMRFYSEKPLVTLKDGELVLPQSPLIM